MIKVNIDRVRDSSASLHTISSKLDQLESQLFSLNYAVDSRIKARKGINSSLWLSNRQIRELETNVKALKSFINVATQKYENAEKNVEKRAQHMLKIAGEKAQSLEVCKIPGNGKTPDKVKSTNAVRWDQGLADFLTHNEINLIRDMLVELPLSGLPAYYHLPRFIVDGKYLKVLNSETYHGGHGLARRYTIENIKNNKYPHATKLYNISKWVKGINVVAKVAPWLSGGAEAYNELTTEKKISVERKVSNAVIAGGASVGVGVAGAKIGAAVGTFIAPGVGTVAGAVIGAGVGVLSAYVGDKLLKAEIWGSGKNKKSTLGVVQDVVGDGVEAVGSAVKGAAEWVGGLFNSKPKTGAVSPG
ncbi:bacteriocin class II family protein [Mesobacillus selenatarsenatis]|uniref:Uncharacterized protein n=1 Tax=Mesobacillus selenatarsenatis TaxID=388741 RepID=A0A846TF23_9BACI|nr:bacteriocin class II family protein [Mesobacillus selenatarsenatis]NKE04774.1 hypothetical protein [Mesobacillus selenatarsenatis]